MDSYSRRDFLNTSLLLITACGVGVASASAFAISATYEKGRCGNLEIKCQSLRFQLHASLNVTNKYVHLIARYGYGPNTVHSLRRPVEDVIV